MLRLGKVLLTYSKFLKIIERVCQQMTKQKEQNTIDKWNIQFLVKEQKATIKVFFGMI